MASSSVSFNLGIDFGTQYTKVCVRDLDRDNSWVVIPGEPTTQLQSSLVLSQVGIHPDGRLCAGLTQPEWKQYLKAHPDVRLINFIKMRLAQFDQERAANNWYSSDLPTIQGVNLANPDSFENLCAFFLCQVIKRSKEWTDLHKSDLSKGVDIDWSANIGVPVEYCDSPTLVRFHRILCLAWDLSTCNLNQVTLSAVEQYLRKLRSSLNFESMPCFPMPEMAAAIYSYASSPQAQRGTYVFFDIGGGTMEAAAFKFHRNNPDAKPQIDFLAGMVEPVGVNALAKRVAYESIELERKIEYSIIHNGPALVSNIDVLSTKYQKTSRLKAGDFIANKYRIPVRVVQASLKRENLKLYTTQVLILAQALIHRQVATIIQHCAKKLPKQEMQKLTVFLGGGGMLSTYYVDTIEATYDAFNLKSTLLPRFQIKCIPVPRDLSMSGLEGKHFHRFSIAYGLSIADYAAPRFRLPTQIESVKPLTTSEFWIPETALHDG